MAINIYRLAFPAQQHVMNTELELPFNELYTLANAVQGRANQTQAGLDKLKDIFAEDKVATFDVDAYHNDLSLLDQKVQAFHEKFANSYSTPEALREFQSLAREIQMDHARKANLYRQSYDAEQNYLNAKKESDKWGKYYNTFQSDLGYSEQSKRGTFKKNEDGTYDYENPQVYNYTPYTPYADINEQMQNYVKGKKPSGYYRLTVDGLFIVGNGEEGVYQDELKTHLLNNKGAFKATKAGDNLKNLVFSSLYQNLGRVPTEDEFNQYFDEVYNTYADNTAYEFSHVNTKHTENESRLYEGKNAQDIYNANHMIPSGKTTSFKTNLPSYDELVKQNREKTTQYNNFINERNKFPKGSPQWEAYNNKAKDLEAELSIQDSMLEAAQGEAYRNKLPAQLYNIWERFKDIGVASPENPNGFTWDSLNVDEKNAVLKYMEENKKAVVGMDYDLFGNKRGIKPQQLVPSDWSAQGKSDQDLFHDVMEVVKFNVTDSDVSNAYTEMSKNEQSFQHTAYGVQQTPFAAHQDPMGKIFFNMLIKGNLSTTILDDKGLSFGSATEDAWKVLKASKNGSVVDIVKDPVYGGYRMTVQYDSYKDASGVTVPAGTAVAIVKPGESNIPTMQGQFLMNSARDALGNIINQQQYEDGLNMMNDHFYWQANNLNPDAKVKLSQLVINPENKNDYQKVKDVATLEEKVNHATGVHTFILTPAPGMKYNSGSGEILLDKPIIYGSKEAAIKQAGYIFDYNFN